MVSRQPAEIVDVEANCGIGDEAGSMHAAICCARKQMRLLRPALRSSWTSAKPRSRSAREAEAASCHVFKSVDTCAAEFEAYTPYYYSTYEDEDESKPTRAQARS